MKKNIFLIFCLILSGTSTYAENTIAVVDLQQIVSASKEVKQLKKDYAKKTEELNKIIVNARGEISNETDSAKVMLLEDKYTKEFNSKKEMIEKEYSIKLSEIEKNIKNKIIQKSKQDKYDYVLAKSVVLYGGQDITNEILKDIQ